MTTLLSLRGRKTQRKPRAVRSKLYTNFSYPSPLSKGLPGHSPPFLAIKLQQNSVAIYARGTKVETTAAAAAIVGLHREKQKLSI